MLDRSPTPLGTGKKKSSVMSLIISTKLGQYLISWVALVLRKLDSALGFQSVLPFCRCIFWKFSLSWVQTCFIHAFIWVLALDRPTPAKIGNSNLTLWTSRLKSICRKIIIDLISSVHEIGTIHLSDVNLYEKTVFLMHLISRWFFIMFSQL